jgi:hypothetical protein
MNARKTFGGVLVGIGVVLIAIGIIWGRSGYYLDQTPILLTLVVGGGVLAVIGGVVARGSGAPEIPDGARMLSTPDRVRPSAVLITPTTISLPHEATPRERATDPSTSAEELATIALDHPELAALVHGHPNAYDDLRDWISNYRSEELAAGNGHPTAAIIPDEPVDSVVSFAPTSSAAQASPAAKVAPAASPTGIALPNTWLGERPRRTVIVAAAIVVAAMIGAGAIIGGFAAAAGDLDRRAEIVAQSDPEPGVDFVPAAQPDPEATMPVTQPVAGRIPDTCDALFSAQYAAAIRTDGYRGDTTSRVTTPAGTADARLAALFSGTRLECTWHRNDADTTGLETSVMEVDAASAAAATQRFQELGFATLDELGGTRWFQEVVQADGVHTGESHIIRDGIWFATRWIGYGPDGYTADMVHRIFG